MSSVSTLDNSNQNYHPIASPPLLLTSVPQIMNEAVPEDPIHTQHPMEIVNLSEFRVPLPITAVQMPQKTTVTTGSTKKIGITVIPLTSKYRQPENVVPKDSKPIIAHLKARSAARGQVTRRTAAQCKPEEKAQMEEVESVQFNSVPPTEHNTEEAMVLPGLFKSGSEDLTFVHSCE